MDGDAVETRRERLRERPEKLMVSGPVTLEQGRREGVEIRRGMVVRGQEGGEIGEVAAVVVAGPAEEVTHVVLARLHMTTEYRLIRVELIAGVHEDNLYLRIRSHTVGNLPVRQPS